MDLSNLDPVEVSAKFSTDGKITPYRFTWQGRNYQVASVGRNWKDETGLHILVMAPGDRIFELIYIPDQMRWVLRRLDGVRSLM
jgi:hypothetical protein